MGAALISDFSGTSGSATNITPFTLSLSQTFPTNIPAGSMIIVHAAMSTTAPSVGLLEGPTVQSSITGGPTGNWRTPAGGSINVGTTQLGFSITYLQNCPAVTAGDTINVDFVFSGSGILHTINATFHVYAFSGMATNANPSNVIDKQSSFNNSGTPRTGNLANTQVDLVLCGYAAATGGCTAGSGFILGTDLSAGSTRSQLQYKLDALSGSNSTSFAGSIGSFSAGAVSLKELLSVGSTQASLIFF